MWTREAEGLRRPPPSYITNMHRHRQCTGVSEPEPGDRMYPRRRMKSIESSQRYKFRDRYRDPCDGQRLVVPHQATALSLVHMVRTVCDSILTSATCGRDCSLLSANSFVTSHSLLLRS